MKNRAVCVPLTVVALLALLLPAAPAAGASVSAGVAPCTIMGTADDDVLQGTDGNDVICGFAGDDILVGFDGDDILRGGPGNDILVGGDGNDRLFGDDGADQLVDTREPGSVDGGAGPDLCVAAAGSAATGCERLIFQPTAGSRR